MVDKMTRRRTKAEVLELKDRLLQICTEHYPLTVREAFYLAVNAGLVAKEEREYKNTVMRLIGELREEGLLPWSWIVDGTRLMRKPASHASLAEALDDLQDHHKRDVWKDQTVYVEIWCEKDALSAVIYPITARWDVPLMIGRGFSSKTFLHSAAESIEAEGKPTYIYIIGDYDPSGMKIAANVEKKLRKYAPGADIHVERIAITPAQVKKYTLPTRPTKWKSESGRANPHASGFKGIGKTRGSIEADALRPDVLRELVGLSIMKHLDMSNYASTKIAEWADRVAIRFEEERILNSARSLQEDKQRKFDEHGSVLLPQLGDGGGGTGIWRSPGDQTEINVQQFDAEAWARITQPELPPAEEGGADAPA